MPDSTNVIDYAAWRATGRVRTRKNIFGHLIFQMEETALVPIDGCLVCGRQESKELERRWRTVRPRDIDILTAAIMNRSLNMP